jgi:hypothetical protein
MLALRSERVMIFAGPCSPRFTADTLVVSVNVGEGGPPAPAREALRFPCAFVVIVKGRRGRDIGIGERGFGRVAAGREGEGRGAGRTVEAFGGNWRFALGGLKWCSRAWRYTPPPCYARRVWPGANPLVRRTFALDVNIKDAHHY